jgi:ABC-type lipoprotein export system ATPase subunit
MPASAADRGLAIRARDLRFSYRERGGHEGASFALWLPSWDVPRGASAVLHGPSGCGKSTLLNLISGALRPERGSLEVEGLDLVAASDARRRAHRIRSVGIVFQDFPLVDYLDATENVLLPYRLNPALRLDRAARDRARALLDQLGLGSRLTRRPATLSQGERQRVAIARAIVHDPDILFADEPTGNLDTKVGEEILAVFEDFHEQGRTVVLVTHELEVALRAKRLIRVVDGLIVEDRPT